MCWRGLGGGQKGLVYVHVTISYAHCGVLPSTITLTHIHMILNKRNAHTRTHQKHAPKISYKTQYSHTNTTITATYCLSATRWPISAWRAADRPCWPRSWPSLRLQRSATHQRHNTHTRDPSGNIIYWISIM